MAFSETTTVWDRLPATPGVVVDIWTNTYDDLGRLASVSSPTGEVLYEYDSQGRQIRVATRPNGFIPADADDVSTDIRYTYDLLGRLASVQTWERNDIAVDADPTTAGQQPETESYVYDVLGNLDRELNPDGTVTDYTFDDLNRLTDIDETRADGTKLSEYDYTLRADGKRDFAEEKLYAEDGSLISHTTFDWEYDAAGRLTDEIFTNVDGLLFDIDDYHTSFQYDLTGNRVGRTTITDTDNDGVIDEFADTVTQTDYIQDANDRITSETSYVDGSETTSTTYGYDHTQQTSKEVFTNSGGFSELTSEQRFTYNVQGRLASAITETFEFGSINSRQRVSYRYGADGIRFIATEEVDNVLDPFTENWTVAQVTEYLVDAQNHTGYQQVLEETVTDGSGNLVRKVVYTIGHDHISQTTFGPSDPVEGMTLVFHMDGHGSTRILTDLAGTIANLATPQIFHYTAYGKAINFTMGEAATQYLYSGEQFDSRVGQQYLRARYYNQSTGSFNRLDPFFGSLNDAQSLHKYLYTHGDPVNGVDPTGLFISSIGSLASTSIVANTSIMNLTQGSLVSTALLTFGDAGMKFYRAGITLAAAGQIDVAFQLYELGGMVFGLGAHLAEVATSSVEAFTLANAVIGLTRLGIAFFRNGGLQKIASLFRRIRQAPGALVTHLANPGTLGNSGRALSQGGFEAYEALVSGTRRTQNGQLVRTFFKRVPRSALGRSRAQYVVERGSKGRSIGTLYLANDATVFEAHHEFQHFLVHLELGEQYLDYSKSAHEYVVYQRTKLSPIWNQMDDAERTAARLQITAHGPEDSSLWELLKDNKTLIDL